MNTLSIAVREVRYRNKAFWRNPAAAVFTFIFPLMFLVIFTALFGNNQVFVFGRPISTSTYYVSAIAAFSIITATYTNLAISVCLHRDSGVLKRVRGTPLPAWAHMFGRIAHSIIVALLLVTIVAAFGALLYNAEVPTKTFWAFLATIAVGAASFSALGLAITCAIPNADASPAIVNVSILPLLFLSDIFIPIMDPNAWHVSVAKFFPLYPFAQAMKAAYFSPSGTGFRGEDLLVVGLWGVAGALIAVRFFSWEPRR